MPRPRVTVPMMGSPGTGEQHLAIWSCMPASPSTRIPVPLRPLAGMGLALKVSAVISGSGGANSARIWLATCTEVFSP
ncbi:hypothetical protein D3C86_1112120 [compost metagenome]